MGDLLKRLKCEKGFELVLTTLAITGLIALGSGLYSLGKGAREAKADQVDITKYSEISASGDPGKDQEKNSAGLVEIAIKGGETAAGAYDDTGLLIILDKSGALKVKGGSTEEDDKIKDKLTQKQLPADKLHVDMAKTIKKQVKTKSKAGTADENLDAVIYGIMEDIEGKLEILDELQEEDYEDIDDLDILDDLEKELEDKGLLEDPEKIELKKKLSRLESEKKYLEEKLASYQEYEDKGYIVADASGLKNLNDRLEDVENKISQVKSSLGDDAGSKVTLSGQGDLRGFSESTITITINLETGRVTGNILCYGSQPYDGESGIYCRYKFSSELNGSIDLDTGKLTVRASGYVNGISGGVCAGVKPTSYSTTLEGTLDESSAHISGTSSMGGAWQASSSN